ncbi:hypothetical protein GCM10010182_80770 [Actinomadura cremea]|nr:hypothetical protein GCM10010182_80770 [Actinomadura cremea]
MIQGHAALHAWARERVHSASITAMRADARAVAAFVQDPPGLDPHTRAFLRDARALALASTTALVAVLERHRPDGWNCLAYGTPECRTLRRVAGVLAAHSVHPAAIDRAEAWRRADACLTRDHRPKVLIGIAAFEYGFVAWPAFDMGEGDFVLILDARTGAVTRWPRLPRDVLTRENCDHLPARPDFGF